MKQGICILQSKNTFKDYIIYLRMNLPGFLGFLKDKTANFPDPVTVKIGKKFSWNQNFTKVKRLQNPNLDWVKSLGVSEDVIAMQIKHVLLFHNFTNISVLEEILWQTYLHYEP